MKTFIINLPRRTDRLERTILECEKFGIEYNIFPAFEGGADGLRRTMVALFEQEREGDILVLEDDVRLLHDPTPFLYPDFHFDCLFLGGNVYQPLIRYNDNYARLTSCVANHAVVYSQPTRDRLINWYSMQQQPIDITLDQIIVNEGNSFITIPLVATQYPEYSDIENKHVDYKHLLERRYEHFISKI